jgi:transcriptional regulator with XRE-family HTH domain
VERLDGNRIRSLRRRTGLTQAQLAQRAGIGGSTLKRIEAGLDLKVHPATISAVAGALRVDPAELFQTQPSAPLREATHAPSGSPGAAAHPFVGRNAELEHMGRLLDAACRGSGGVCLLEGEPGVGKTRLAAEAESLAAARSMRALSAWCHDGEGAPSYWPWIQLLRACARDVPADRLRADLGHHAEVVLSAFPELHERPPDPLASGASLGEQARFNLFDGVTRLLVAEARRQPLLLVVDDLHSADGASLRLFEFLSHEAAQAPLLLLGAHRSSTVDLSDHARQVLSRVHRQNGCTRIELRGFALSDVSALVSAAGLDAELDPARVRRIHERTGGNPLFVRELVRRVALDGGESAPDAVRDLLASRLSRLSREARELLRAASIVGSEWPEGLVHAIAAVDAEGGGRALDEVVASGLIRRLTTAGRFGFIHALFREAVYAELRSDRRQILHRRAAEWLRASAAPVHAGELAYHAYHSADLDAGRAALEWTARAAAHAMTRLAYEDAADHYARGLELVERFGAAHEMERCELLTGLGEARMAAGNRSPATRAFLDAARVARPLRSGPALARIALGLAPGILSLEIVPARAELVALLRDALQLCADHTELSARLLARLALALAWSAPPAETRSLVDRAVELAGACGSASAEAFASNARFLVCWSPSNLDERLRDAADLLARTLRAADPSLEVVCRVARFCTMLEAGDVPALCIELEAFDRLAEDLRQPQALCYREILRASMAMLKGSYADMSRYRDAAIRIGESVGDVNARHAAGVFDTFLAWEEGRFEDAVAATERGASDFGAWRNAWMHMLAECGRRDEAHAMLRGLFADGRFILRFDLLWLCHTISASEACIVLEDTELARPLYEALLPYRDRIMVIGYGWGAWGSAERTLGGLAALLGAWEQSKNHFGSALRINGRIGARAMVVRTKYGYATMLLARDAAGDRLHATQMIDAARGEAEALGMLDLRQRLEALHASIARA